MPWGRRRWNSTYKVNLVLLNVTSLRFILTSVTFLGHANFLGLLVSCCVSVLCKSRFSKFIVLVVLWLQRNAPKNVMQELSTDFLKLSLLLALRLLKHMSRRHVVSNLLLGAFSFPSLQYLALHFFLSLVYLNMRSVCITMITDFQTLKGFVKHL